MSSSQFYLIIHSGYQSVFIGLYNRTQAVSIQTLDKKMVSGFLFITLLDILKCHELIFADLSFIGVHAGPAPFTTLRVGVTTSNGIAFAAGLPLVAVNGLEVLSNLYPEYTVLLNAFCDDVYVGQGSSLSCQNIDAFLHNQASSITQPVTYIGNGVALHHEKIKHVLGDRAVLLHDYPYEASIDMIAQYAYRQWSAGANSVKQVMPVYMKEYSAKMATNR